MKSAPPATPAPAASPRRASLKVLLVFLAIALAAVVVADWESFKAGFIDGYRDAAIR